MLAAILVLALLGLALGLGLGLAARFLRVEGNPLVEEVTAMMPGSQCGQCGFPGCGPAAEAMVAGKAPVTCCPPGGRALAEALAAKLGVSVDLSGMVDKPPAVAFVNEALCIGCTRCFKRCPTDAIVGAAKQIHAVVADACTGCEQCVDVCPTACLEMRPIRPTLDTWYWSRPTPGYC